MARFSNPFSQYLSDSGRILPGAKLFFYVNGTTTPQATYEDAAFTVVNPNPVICDSAGRVPDIYMPGNLVYSIRLTDTDDAQIAQADDITGSDSRVSSSDVIAALAANTDPVVINGSSATINADTTIDGTLEVNSTITALGGGSNPALTGAIRMPNNQSIRARDNANSADIFMIGTNTADTLLVGADTDIGFIQLGTTSGPDTFIRGDLNMTLGGNVRMASGNGIDFSAAAGGGATSSLLDDYEEGTFTPTLQFGGASVGITYSQRTGTYTKVGNLVTASINIVLSNKGTSIGNAQIAGLPYVSSNANLYLGSFYPLSIINAGEVHTQMGSSSTTIPLTETTTTGLATNLTNADFSNTSAPRLTITYQSQ